jgi:transcriptional regulator with XRE-family HTH domain
MNTFGELISNLRKEKGYTIREFAKIVQLSPGFISQLERNKANTFPNEENIRKMAKILDYDEFQLLAEAKKVPTEIQEAFFTDPKKVVYLCRRISNKNDK